MIKLNIDSALISTGRATPQSAEDFFAIQIRGGSKATS